MFIGGDFTYMLKYILIANKSELFAFIVSMCGILGFFLSIYLTIKSKSISRELKELTAKKIFNKNRSVLIEHFMGYQMSIIEDDNKTPTLRHNLLAEVYNFEEQYKTLLGFKDKFTIALLKHQLKSRAPNYEKINTYIDYLVAKFKIKEE